MVGEWITSPTPDPSQKSLASSGFRFGLLNCGVLVIEKASPWISILNRSVKPNVWAIHASRLNNPVPDIVNVSGVPVIKDRTPLTRHLRSPSPSIRCSGIYGPFRTEGRRRSSARRYGPGRNLWGTMEIGKINARFERIVRRLRIACFGISTGRRIRADLCR